MALILVLVVIFTTLSVIALRQLTTNFRTSNSLHRYLRLRELAIGGIHQTLHQIRNGDLPMGFEEHVIEGSECIITQVDFGLYKKIRSTAVEQDDTVRVTATLGYSADDLFEPALVLSGNAPRLVISTGTFVCGDLAVNGGDVSYSPHYVANQDTQDGYIITVQFDADSLLVYDQLNTFVDSLENEIEFPDRDLIYLEGGTYSPDEFNDQGMYLVDEELVIHSDRRDTLSSVQLICSSNCYLTGALVLDNSSSILCGSNLFIKDSTHFQDGFAFSQDGLYFQEFSQGSGQFLSAKQVLIKDHSRIDFPSSILVAISDEKIFGEPELAITDDAEVNAFLAVYNPNPSDTRKYSRMFQGKVQVAQTATFTGGIYCEGNTEFYQTLNGFIYSTGIEQMDRRTRWTNYLKNTFINRGGISIGYPLPLIFDKLDQIQILELEVLD